MNKLILLTLLFFSFNSFSTPIAEVLKVKGIVDYQGQEVSKGMELAKKGILTTGKKSFVKILIKKWGNTIVLGPNSEMKLEIADKNTEKKYSLLKGSCRWVTEKIKKESKGKIFSPLAAMGVRGTDYWLKVNHLLNETEVVVFEGKVEMQNVNDDKDKFLLNEGQWGGIGGRFGKKLVKPINLPTKVIKQFNRYLKI